MLGIEDVVVGGAGAEGEEGVGVEDPNVQRGSNQCHISTSRSIYFYYYVFRK